MQQELIIGCHLSSGKGYEAMAKSAQSIGANTFAFFTRNPRGGAAKAIDPEDIKRFEEACKEAGIDKIVAHGSYTINPCSAKESVREFALQALVDDLARMEYAEPTLQHASWLAYGAGERYWDRADRRNLESSDHARSDHHASS